MRIAVAFTNFGPYHLARLRALGERLAPDGGELIAHEMAGSERRYPWLVDRGAEPFAWTTLFPGRSIEDVPAAECRAAMVEALDRDDPDAVAACGYSRPESMAALRWAERRGRPAILMSESQKIDHPRVWWKEAVKRGRVRRFSAALVGGPRHRDYLIDLGMDPRRIAMGYNAVDDASYGDRARAWRTVGDRNGLPPRPYFLAVNRFVPEKNLVALVRAFAAYRNQAAEGRAWDLVLCGGGPSEAEVDAAVEASGMRPFVHRPGFLQAAELSRVYAFAGGFVHPSLLEPWGLVVNEAAACGLPLLVSDRAGCADTLVPDSPGTTGRKFDPRDETSLTDAMTWLAGLAPEGRSMIGKKAAEVVSEWGPRRFASGMFEALDAARTARRPRAVVGGGA